MKLKLTLFFCLLSAIFCQDSLLAQPRQRAKPVPVFLSEFISQSAPQALITTQKSQVTLNFKNTGRIPWLKGQFALISQNPEQNNTWLVNRIELPLTIMPGETLSLTFEITAPTIPGTYNFQWQLYRQGLGFFGQKSANIQIKVNLPLTLDPIADIRTFEHKPVELKIIAQGGIGNLTYSAANLPPNSIFNPNTQLFNWLPDHGQAGTYPDITFDVGDQAGNRAQRKLSGDVLKTIVFGTIYEKDSAGNNAGLEGVTIDVLLLDRTTIIASGVTGPNGHFDVFKDSWPDGNYFIKASKPGYKTYWAVARIYKNTMIPFSVTLAKYAENEPNNDFASACAIQLSSSVDGTINPTGDRDYFKVNISGGGVLKVSLSGVAGNIDAFIYLYDSSHNYICSAYSGGNGKPSVLQRRLSTGGDYYISIFDGNNDNSFDSAYKLTAEFFTLWVDDYYHQPDIFSPDGDGVNDSVTITAWLSDYANWRIDIKDEGSQVKRTFTGNGSLISQIWYGKDGEDNLVSDGRYTYVITAIDPGTGKSSPEVSGVVTLDNTPPQTVISEPLSGASVSGLVPIKGIAYDANFSQGSLYYGEGQSPSNWHWLTDISKIGPAAGLFLNWDSRESYGYYATLKLEVSDLAGHHSQTIVPIITQNEGPNITEFSAAPNIFSPDGFDEDNTNDVVKISFKLSYPGFTKVEVYNPYGILIRTIASEVLYPDPAKNMQFEFQWNGRNDAGELLKNDRYYEIRVSTDNGAKQEWAYITVNNKPVFSDVSIRPWVLSPDWDGIDDEVKIHFWLTEDSRITIKVYDAQDNLIKTLDEDWLLYAGEIYDYYWDGKDNNHLPAAYGQYYLKVTAVALTGKVADPLIRDLRLVPFSYASGIYISTDTFNPSTGQAARIFYDLTNDAQITIKIYNSQDALVRTLVDGEPRAAGPQTETWNGRDNSGNIANDDYYYFIIEDSISGAAKIIYDPRGTGGEDISHNIDFSATDFAPLDNQSCILNYNLFKPAKVNIKIRLGRYEGPVIGIIKYQEPQGSGPHTAIWDGRDESKNIVSYNKYTLAIWGYTLPDNAIRITGGIPVISGVTVSPLKFNPVFNPYTVTQQNTTAISYELSQAASVTMEVYDINNNFCLKLLDDALKPAGLNSIIWGGKNGSGKILPAGYYKIEIQARNGENHSDVIRAHTEVSY